MKNMKNILLILVGFISLELAAQQDPQYSMYMFNGLAINPAYAGSAEGINANVLYRSQWTGIDGAPNTIVANVHKAFMQEKIGAGISFNNDQIGVMDRNTISLAGAYHLKFKYSKLAFGLQANYSQYNIGLSRVQHSQDNAADPTFAANLSESTINFGAGVFYYADKFFAGISVPSILNNDLSATEITGGQQALEVPHFLYNAGYIWAADPMIDIKPSVLIRHTTGAPINFDLNVNAYYKKFIGLGVGYRSSNALVAMLECQVHPYVKLGYAYDRELTDLGVFARHTHEVLLRFTMGPKGTQISPRLY